MKKQVIVMEVKGQKELREAFEVYLQRVRGDLQGSVSAEIAPELLRCDQAKLAYTLAFRTTDWMRNPNGVTHGGITAAMLDTAMGLMVRINAPDRATSTISMSVNYVLPVPVGRAVHVDVSVSRMGGTVAHTTGRMYDPERPDAALATASGVYHLGGRRS